MKSIHAFIRFLNDDKVNRILTIIALLLLVAVMYFDNNPHKFYFFGTIAKSFIFLLLSYLFVAYLIAAVTYFITKNLTVFETCLAKNIVVILFIVAVLTHAIQIF